jgi:hypothetical protein
LTFAANTSHFVVPERRRLMKLISWNIRGGRRHSEVVDAVRALGPDVAVLDHGISGAVLAPNTAEGAGGSVTP